MKFEALQKKIPFQWRIQAFYPSKQNANNCQCVAYIDARDVMTLLDETCTPAGWMSDYKEVKGRMYGGIAILCGRTETNPGEWVWKWDCGVESETEGEKGEASDAFKRAAVKWGIGRFLYDMGLQRLSARSENGKAYPIDNNGNRIYDLTKYINDMNKTPAQKLGPFSVGKTMEQHEAEQAAKEAPQTAPAAPTKDYTAAPVGDEITTHVKNVFKKTGPKKDGSSYTRYSITMENKDEVTTFSHTFGEIADKSLESGLQVAYTYKANGKWKDLLTLRLTDDAAAEHLEDGFMRNIAEPMERRNRW